MALQQAVTARCKQNKPVQHHGQTHCDTPEYMIRPDSWGPQGPRLGQDWKLHPPGMRPAQKQARCPAQKHTFLARSSEHQHHLSMITLSMIAHMACAGTLRRWQRSTVTVTTTPQTEQHCCSVVLRRACAVTEPLGTHTFKVCRAHQTLVGYQYGKIASQTQRGMRPTQS